MQITKFHIAKKGKTVLQNSQALCSRCNIKKSIMQITDKITLRKWQGEAVNKALKWFIEKKKDKRFLVNAAPGTGKTFMACALAKILFDKKKLTVS